MTRTTEHGLSRSYTKSASPGPSQMQLSICIPTYNRSSVLAVLIRSIIATLPTELKRQTEIVVSDNHSSDGTSNLIKNLFENEPLVRLCSPPTHLPTAEENLCYAISQCKGEYVWTLGDDDSVDPNGLLTLKSIIDEGSVDFAIFNSRATSFFGMPLRMTRIPCFARVLDVPILDFVRLAGFWFVISGFSTTVFRRELANVSEFEDILSLGKIYSHVVWLIYSFANHKFVFVNEPLVNYRQNLSDVVPTGHWENVAQREKTSVGGLWSTSFLRQLDYLVERKVINRTFVREVLDRNLVSRFYFADEMLAHFNRGLRHDLQTGTLTVSTQDIEYFQEWANLIWSDNLMILSLLEDAKICIRDGKPAQAETIENLSIILDSRSAQMWCDRFHVYDTKGYSVYGHAGRWFAVQNNSFELARPHLEYLDFQSHLPELVVAQTEEQLIGVLDGQKDFVASNFSRENSLIERSHGYRDRLIEYSKHMEYERNPPSRLKRALILLWDNIPSGIQKAIEPLADKIDKLVD
jgi:glycosyltransferase involved in cell wall biosynthesis